VPTPVDPEERLDLLLRDLRTSRALLFALPFPFIVWGADELRRYLLRRRQQPAPQAAGPS
jgi:hypothetical protein